MIANPLDQDDNEPENGLEATPNAAKHSLRAAINAHCKSCGYDDTRNNGMGAWREQITDCPVTKCELWSVRPMSKPKKKPLAEVAE